MALVFILDQTAASERDLHWQCDRKGLNLSPPPSALSSQIILVPIFVNRDFKRWEPEGGGLKQVPCYSTGLTSRKVISGTQPPPWKFMSICVPTS